MNMDSLNYILYDLAKASGYEENLCLLLHAKEVECLNFSGLLECEPHPFIYVIQEGIEDGCEENELIKMSLGQMDYIFRCDCVDGEDPRIVDRQCAMEGGQKTYSLFLSSDGCFDYQRYFKHLKRVRKGQLAKLLASTEHSLP